MVVNAVRTYDRLPFIDTWRAIAVTLVILAHLTLNREMKQYMQVSRLLKFLGEHGETGVFIFFFISGYVVSKACLAEIATSGGFSISGFYTRRFFRIVPPLLVYLTACLTLAQFELVGFSKVTAHPVRRCDSGSQR